MNSQPRSDTRTQTFERDGEDSCRGRRGKWKIALFYSIRCGTPHRRHLHAPVEVKPISQSFICTNTLQPSPILCPASPLSSLLLPSVSVEGQAPRIFTPNILTWPSPLHQHRQAAFSRLEPDRRPNYCSTRQADPCERFPHPRHTA